MKKVVLDCAFIHILLIIEHNGDVSPKNLIIFLTDHVYAFVCHCGCLSVGQYTYLTTDKTLVSSEHSSMQFIHELRE